MQLGGMGVGLPYPTKNFPSSTAAGLRSGLVLALSNEFALPAGGMLQVPPGNWFIDTGKYSSIQWLDPVTGLWRTIRAVGSGVHYCNSDGTNYRVVNPLGTPVGALVTNVGSGYNQATTTVTASAGGSTWRAIVGGAVNTTVTIGNDPAGNAGGTNWTYPPIVMFDAPPAGGVPATGYATVSGGAVTAITVVDQGAGYLAAPNVTLYPNPLDPLLGQITIPACTATLTGTGEVAAVLQLTPGTALTTAPTLTIAGNGSSATATAVMALTVTALTVGTGTNGTPITSAGGLVTTAAGAIVNPSISTGLFVPRPFQGYESGASTGVIVDGGMFQVAPTASASAGTVSFTMGSTYDVIVMQAVPGT